MHEVKMAGYWWPSSFLLCVHGPTQYLQRAFSGILYGNYKLLNLHVADHTVEYSPLNWSITARLLTKRYNNKTLCVYKKIANMKTRKAWHTFLDWCLLIDTVQSFWRNSCIWYPINSAEWHSVVFCLPASNFLTKALGIQWIFFGILHFITFLLIYSLVWFTLKQHAYNFFSFPKNTPGIV